MARHTRFGSLCAVVVLALVAVTDAALTRTASHAVTSTVVKSDTGASSNEKGLAATDAVVTATAIAEAACPFKRETKVHCCDPNQYYHRERKVLGGRRGCGWTRWRSRPFAKKPFPFAVERRGKWYENAVSNRYYEGYGKWKAGRASPNPDDPTLERVAGKWVPRKTAGSFYRGKNGRWYKSKTSNLMYRRGKWVRQRRRLNPTNPKLWWVAGEWQPRPLTSAPELKHLSFRGGRWWKGPVTMRPQCFFFWRRGRWVRSRQVALRRNDPRYRYTRRGTFERRAPLAIRKYVRRDGRWYRDAKSNMYYHNLRWVRDSPHRRDPRWRRKGGKWVKRDVRRIPGSKHWVRDGDRWYKSKSRTFAWSFPRWRRVRRTRAQRAALALRMQRQRLLASASPIDLDAIVERSSTQYYGRFLKWFLRDYLGATARTARTAPRRDPSTPEPGPIVRPDVPEPGPPSAFQRRSLGSRIARPVDLEGRRPWRSQSVTPMDDVEKARIVDGAEIAREKGQRWRRQGRRNAAFVRFAEDHAREERRPNAGLDRDYAGSQED